MILQHKTNKIKESKNWISGELETINNSIATPDTGLKGLTSSQMQTKAQKKTGNTSDSSTNTKAMTTQTQPEDTYTLDKGKGNLYIIIDSNRNFINFKELLAGEFNNQLTPIVIPCGNIRKAESILNSTKTINPHIILLQIVL